MFHFLCFLVYLASLNSLIAADDPLKDGSHCSLQKVNKLEFTQQEKKIIDLYEKAKKAIQNLGEKEVLSGRPLNNLKQAADKGYVPAMIDLALQEEIKLSKEATDLFFQHYSKAIKENEPKYEKIFIEYQKLKKELKIPLKKLIAVSLECDSLVHPIAFSSTKEEEKVSRERQILEKKLSFFKEAERKGLLFLKPDQLPLQKQEQDHLPKAFTQHKKDNSVLITPETFFSLVKKKKDNLSPSIKEITKYQTEIEDKEIQDFLEKLKRDIKSRFFDPLCTLEEESKNLNDNNLTAMISIINGNINQNEMLYYKNKENVCDSDNLFELMLYGSRFDPSKELSNTIQSTYEKTKSPKNQKVENSSGIDKGKANDFLNLFNPSLFVLRRIQETIEANPLLNKKQFEEAAKTREFLLHMLKRNYSYFQKGYVSNDASEFYTQIATALVRRHDETCADLKFQEEAMLQINFILLHEAQEYAQKARKYLGYTEYRPTIYAKHFQEKLNDYYTWFLDRSYQPYQQKIFTEDALKDIMVFLKFGRAYVQRLMPLSFQEIQKGLKSDGFIYYPQKRQDIWVHPKNPFAIRVKKYNKEGKKEEIFTVSFLNKRPTGRNQAEDPENELTKYVLWLESGFDHLIPGTFSPKIGSLWSHFSYWAQGKAHFPYNAP